jgi:hypothetical protein
MIKYARLLVSFVGCGTVVSAQDVTVTYAVKWDFEVIQGGGAPTPGRCTPRFRRVRAQSCLGRLRRAKASRV